VVSPLTDTHCHLDFNAFEGDREAVLARAWEAGLERILVPGIDLESSRAAVGLSAKYSKVYAAVGVHPNSALTWEPGSLRELQNLASHPKVCAIGEIGLDYYRDRAPRDTQKLVFQEQLALAGEIGLPVIIHVRNTSPSDRACIQDVLDLLSSWRAELVDGPGMKKLDERLGVLHSFSGNQDEAKRALSLGFFLGFTGPVTFKKATELREVVASVPLERILIETDGPFLTPHPYRGKRNEPARVFYVAEKISEVHNRPFEQVAEITTANAMALFQWGNPVEW
jgi:TatD DNase family protein